MNELYVDDQPLKELIDLLDGLTLRWEEFQKQCQKDSQRDQDLSRSLFKQVLDVVVAVSTCCPGTLKRRVDQHGYECHVVPKLSVFVDILEATQVPGGEQHYEILKHLDQSDVETVRTLIFKLSKRCYHIIPRKIKPILCGRAVVSLFDASLDLGSPNINAALGFTVSLDPTI